ncbi:flavohemoglobin expression-modulating QEGLA motif protein [Rhizobium sp. 32-5/1]|uniref:flavohemoglobin expression-modulating QEGLA motif protein n=1 Tax=Rhizobium sp. 32-5/1 TaxID=3019602 RepID=UPI00240E5AD6|nr:flavohemoglobin expression-modulating QEGLA motif protein [Rhizobium sp. 32-5/1]WEZ84466.1 flavohemoglobin expression-modulating QEGLA motif protein [Rhizobium sp. 32-5/1]
MPEVLASIETGKSVRKEFGEGGRLHIDRPLPFLCVYIERGRDDAVARNIVSASAVYLLAPDVDVALPIVEAVGAALERRFGAFMLLEIGELAADTLLTDDAPYLPPFEVKVFHTDDEAASVAARTLVQAVQGIKAKFRTPRAELAAIAQASTSDAAFPDTLFPCISVRVAPIYRLAKSEKIYPDLQERLVANIFDAGLQALAAFIKAKGALKLTTHRQLGRKAFVDAVSRADRSIDEIASSFDFLLAVTPINADAAWQEFKAGGFRKAPRFLYRPLTVDIELEKRKLFTIGFDRFEDPVLHALYREKQQELDLQLSLLAAREMPRFIELGRALYGPVEPSLLQVATQILADTSVTKASLQEPETADCFVLDMLARAMIAGYRNQYSGFEATVELRSDLPSGLMVSGNRLLISRNTLMDRARVGPLLSHEVGVHLLTYFNGSAQGLRLFRSGLAGYEGMQEGLAVFAEYLSGGMTVERLRLIAARVVGCAMMLEGVPFERTFSRLTDEHGLAQSDAFNLVLRLYRGGGLAKDAIYLRGLLQLLEHLKSDRALDPFWMGKISASHFSVMQELSARGLLKAPVVRPDFLSHPDAQARLERSRNGISPVDMIEL